MKFLGKATIEAEPSTRKTGRGLEIALALGLVLAALVPVVAAESNAPEGASDHHSADFRTVATQLINSSALNPVARVRKNAKDMTPGERKQFVDAILKLKATVSPFDETQQLSYYDQFVQWHKDLYVCEPGEHTLGLEHGMTMSHGSPLFLPWHRVYLLMFENALREVAGNSIMVPYWDWTDAEATKSVFRDDLMGGHGDPNAGWAITGPFNAKDWKLTVDPEGAQWASSASTHIIRRALTEADYAAGFPTAEQVVKMMDIGTYDAEPYDTRTLPSSSFRTTIEGFIGDPYPAMNCGPDGWMTLLPPTDVVAGFPMHNLVHETVGGIFFGTKSREKLFGTMSVPTSPNDPVFFLHHANIDRLWAQWQAKTPGNDYVPQLGHPGLNGTDFMAPWNMTPNSVEEIKKLGYRYE